jgi:parallel beta-helix repeat protein
MKRLACIILIATILFGGLFFVKTTHATTVSGALTVDTHWTQSDSPINLNGTLTVGNNATLTIDPGVTVNLGIYGLYVSGTLNATGDPSNEIIFTASAISNDTTTINAPIMFASASAPWNDASNTGSIIQNANLNQIYLTLYNASPKIDNCQFNFQTSYQSTISINGGSPIISNCVVAYNNQADNGNANCVNIFGGAPQITNNRFEGAYANYSSNEIKVNSGTPAIINNLFDGDYRGSSNNGITVSSGNPVISNNQFKGKGYLTGIVVTSSAQFAISNNIFSNCNSGITVQAAESALTVSGNSFLNGNDGLDLLNGASLTITGNLIDGNSRFGISGGGYIDSNTITNNQVGIHNPPSGTISNNNIVGNALNSIDATTANVNAQNNWWGTTDTQTINQTIYDRKVDRTLGTITFTPFLTQPSPTAPPIPAATPVVTPIPTPLATPQPTETVPIETPTPTIYQYSQTFIYQVGSVFNLNTVVGATAIILILAWIIVILGYGAKRGLSKDELTNKDQNEKTNSELLYDRSKLNCKKASLLELHFYMTDSN